MQSCVMCEIRDVRSVERKACVDLFIVVTPGMVDLAPNALKSDLKKPRICLIWGQSDLLWRLPYHPWFMCLCVCL